MTERRQQESREGTEPTGMAWFELYETLAEYDSAEAYPTRYDRTNEKWIRDSDSPKREVYSLMAGITGATGDFVRCYFDPVTRKWEVIQGAGVTFHRGVTDAAIAKGASGTVSRYSPGTTTDSGTNDTVYNDFADVAITKKVAYIKDGANFYMVAAEC